jgi:hypothetical protein
VACASFLSPSTNSIFIPAGELAPNTSYSLEAVQSAATPGEQVGRAFWEDLDAHPDIAASFDALMGPAGHGVPDPHVLVDPADCESVRTVVDVGGGTGALLAEVRQAWPIA